mgnify:CR=1 FL=1
MEEANFCPCADVYFILKGRGVLGVLNNKQDVNADALKQDYCTVVWCLS